MTDRVEIVRRRLREGIAQAPAPDPSAPPSPMSATTALALFEDQARSREIDIVSRELRAKGEGFYTISSAGHEQNGVVGALLEPTDPCLLHYRSGALVMARARRGGREREIVRDVLLGVVASRDDPIAQGRHKVWGSRALHIPPQTSTIASHLPKAVGLAFALERRRRLAAVDDGIPDDAIVCCSFGDASANHASALAAVNAARWSHRQGAPVPIVLLCEDNGIGISVRTPRRWIETTFGALPHLRYVRADGEVDDVWEAARDAIETCRRTRAPVFLHLPTVRLWGHAGSDVEIGYRGLEEIVAEEERDPLLRNARRLVELGLATPDDLHTILDRVADEVRTAAAEVVSRPRLETREEVMAPLLAGDARGVTRSARGRPRKRDRVRHFEGTLPEQQTAAVRRTLASQINAALHDEMLRRPGMVVFGEDVGRKGGVYHVTAGLHERFGSGRVFDTLLDETTILGLAQGAGLAGLLPVPEIQYLAYIHNALDQIRGEAASTAYFSAGQYRTPMVVRIASFAYQRGFGGHFHNDNAIGALRDIPGVVLAAPSRGDDAARMLRGALALADVDGRVVCFLEPIALYHERDLYEDGDGGWLSDYPPPGEHLLPGEVGVHGADATDVLVVSYANGLRMALRAARRLRDEDGVAARVLDLRWLGPLPTDAVTEHAGDCAAVVVADECRATGGGVADAVVADLAERGYDRPIVTCRSADSFIPLGPAAGSVLLDEDQIVGAARRAVGRVP